MVSASVFGLVQEGLAVVDGTLVDAAVAIGPGLVAGVVLVVVGHGPLDRAEGDPKEYAEADFKKLVLILGILTVHSFPEGVAVGVSFAELGLAGVPDGETVALLGLALPVLAVFMTVASSIHNVPEGVAVSIPLRSMGVSEWRMVWWAVFSSLPQSVGAVIAYYFVTLARGSSPLWLRLCGRGDGLSRRDRVHPRGARGRAGTPARRPPRTGHGARRRSTAVAVSGRPRAGRTRR